MIFRSHSLFVSHCLLFFFYHFLHLYYYHHGLSHCYFIANFLPDPLACLPVSIFVSLQFIFNVTARVILLRCHSFAQNPALFPTVLRTKARAHVMVFKTLHHLVSWCLSDWIFHFSLHWPLPLILDQNPSDGLICGLCKISSLVFKCLSSKQFHG